MSFTLLPTVAPWMVGFAVVALLGAVLAVVAVVDAVRTSRRAVVVPTTTAAPTTRPVRRASTRLHHA